MFSFIIIDSCGTVHYDNPPDCERQFTSLPLVLQEVSKTADHAPARTFYLFCVELEQLARMIQHRAIKVHP